mmetsp:Transcript_15527/g.23553  ORF Transcript_15527/g.23553 Transcript_15527/m.23553 type:complete len:213 (+) Transcript_15527:193-831(+)
MCSSGQHNPRSFLALFFLFNRNIARGGRCKIRTTCYAWCLTGSTIKQISFGPLLEVQPFLKVYLLSSLLRIQLSPQILCFSSRNCSLAPKPGNCCNITFLVIGNTTAIGLQWDGTALLMPAGYPGLKLSQLTFLFSLNTPMAGFLFYDVLIVNFLKMNLIRHEFKAVHTLSSSQQLAAGTAAATTKREQNWFSRCVSTQFSFNSIFHCMHFL